MAFGRKIGPTGRKRDEFSVGAQNKQGKIVAKRETRHGNATLEAYGQEGVREAKQSVHRRNPHTWVKFYIANRSRQGRELEKRRTVTKGGKQFKLSYEVFHASYSKSTWYYYIYAEADGKKAKIRGGNTSYKTKTEATAQAQKAIEELRK